MYRVFEHVSIALLLALHASSQKCHKDGTLATGHTLLQTHQVGSTLRSAHSMMHMSSDDEDDLASVHRKLWSGCDIRAPYPTILLEASQNVSFQRPVSSIDDISLHKSIGKVPLHKTIPLHTTGPAYVLLGPFDTGTNLFEKEVEMNFPQMGLVDIWKHTMTGVATISNQVEANLPAGSNLSSIVVVAMVRNPLQTFVSWRKAPYNIDACLDRAWANMDQPCVGFVATAEPGRPADYPPSRRYFRSTMDIYNRYIQQYRDLKAANVFKDVLLINYEDLVLDPLRVMQEFARAHNITSPLKVKILEAPAKNHGESDGREEAIKTIYEPDYLHAPGIQRYLPVLCKGINASLIRDRVIGSFRKPQQQVSYLRDCESALEALPGESSN